MTLTRFLSLVALGAIFTLTSSAVAQTDMSPTQQAAVKLGRRVETLRQQIRVRPTVVIVPDSASYIQAISRWTLAERYPVLIDNGTDEARESIARFVRAFKPKTVLRWSASDEDRQAVWPSASADRQTSIQNTAAKTWGRDTSEALYAYWKEADFAPPGIIVASTDDPSWTAALALSAFHGQPIIWTSDKPGNPSVTYSTDAFDAFKSTITSGLDALGWPYKGLGDQIDAITICESVPSKVPTSDGKGDIALTDVIGRDETNKRFAWSSMIFGDESQSAYMAMSALFTRPMRAWLFDGYAANFAPPYAAVNAKPLFEAAKFPADFDSPPRGSLAAWRERIRNGVTAGLIHINTSGFPYWFDLTPGRGMPSDVPMLWEPAAVHFVHSYSAQYPSDRGSIAGRWLARGAYSYIGAMEEPTLGAFNPPQVFFSRLFAVMPIAAAARIDEAAPWRVNVFGDPLITLAKPVTRHDEPLTLDGAVNIEERMKEDLKEMRLADGLHALVLLGRDAQVMQIATAALREKNPAVNDQLARIVMPSIFRAGDVTAFTDYYDLMPQGVRNEPMNVDLLWQAGRQVLSGETNLSKETNTKLVGLMRDLARDNQLVEDARILAPAVKRTFGAAAVQSMLTNLLTRAKDEETRRKLNDAVLGR